MSVIPFDRPEAANDGPITEDSTALEFVDRYKATLRFDHSSGAWYRFDGARWRKDGTGVARDCAREIAREMAAGERNDAAKYDRALQLREGRGNIFPR